MVFLLCFHALSTQQGGYVRATNLYYYYWLFIIIIILIATPNCNQLVLFRTRCPHKQSTCSFTYPFHHAKQQILLHGVTTNSLKPFSHCFSYPLGIQPRRGPRSFVPHGSPGAVSHCPRPHIPRHSARTFHIMIKPQGNRTVFLG